MESPAADISRASGLTQRELIFRLGSFTRVRWAMAAMALALLLGSTQLMGVRFVSHGRATIAPALATIGGIFLYNLLFVMLYRRLRAGAHRQMRKVHLQAMGQIACDLLAVCVLVHFTGGVENLFLLLVLLPVVIAAELLPRGAAVGAAAAAAGMVDLLAWSELSGLLGHVQTVWPGQDWPHAFHSDPHYVLAYTVAVTITIFITAAIASSITARLRSRERQLEQTHDLLRQVDENKGFFMRKAGHEMRAPLAAIFSILDALDHMRPNLSVDQVRLIDRGRQRLRALMSMVDDLRRYSRLRADERLAAPARTNLGEIVSSTADLFRQQAADAGVELSCRAAPLEIMGDEELLRELATNLIANAVQYTPRGGQIEVVLSQQGAVAVLGVADTGIGVSEQAREHLFEEFYRAAEAKAAFPAGSGLGLAICKRIVEMHSGTIDAISRPGGGTEFHVMLPV